MNETGYRSLWRDSNLHVIFGITLMAVMGVASITPAFPRIIERFEIDKHQVVWLVTVFTIPGLVLTPVSGLLADRFGRKKVLVPSLLLFSIAGMACTLATSFEMLVVLRFFQGAGAAAIGSLNVTLIGDLYHGRQRAVAMGYNASVLSIGTASYPALGGAVAMFGWFYPFLFPLLALPVGLMVLLVLRNPEPVAAQSFRDYFLAAFRSMFKKQVIVLFCISIITFMILYGAILTAYPLFLSGRFSANTLQIGLIASAMSVTTALTSSQMGKFIKRYSETMLITAGFFLYGLALLLVPLLPGLIWMLIPSVIYGIGQGLNLPSLQTRLAGLAPMEYRGAFMSVNGMVLRGGQTLGPLITGGLILWGGLSMPFFVLAALACSVGITGLFILKSHTAVSQ
ncbi:MAG: MFS transporter [Bacteroidales bacterium]|nr:MFS transporter [Bacteroidales bacterium]